MLNEINMHAHKHTHKLTYSHTDLQQKGSNTDLFTTKLQTIAYELYPMRIHNCRNQTIYRMKMINYYFI